MMDDDEGKKKKKSSWRILEFYSGIGGMRYSVMKAGIEGAEIVEAFDINDKANDVYQHNFGHRPSQGNIQTLTSVELDNYGADAWLMSPPCQPYTRQGLQKHSADARASSFIKIIELIPQMLHPPSMLFVENVVGFETSDTHMQLLKILSENRTYSPYEEKVECESIKAYLQNTDTIGKQLKNKECDDSLEDVEENNFDGKAADRFIVPPNLIDRWGSAMDVVFPDSKRCCCFTKSYYRYVKGTGSLLATAQSGSMKKSTISSLKQLDLRYFTPREVANLHSFPEDFDFPSHVSLRQRYAMLGNSLSVAVVSPLLHYLFSEDFLTC